MSVQNMRRGKKGLRVKGHKLTLEWSGEYGRESTSTATCECGWQEFASSQDECRHEYRCHLEDVLRVEAARARCPQEIEVMDAANEAWYGTRDRFYRDLEDIGISRMHAMQVVSLITSGSGHDVAATSDASRDAYANYCEAMSAAYEAINDERLAQGVRA